MSANHSEPTRRFQGANRFALPPQRGASSPRLYNPRVLRLTCLLIAAALAAPALQARELPKPLAQALRAAAIPQANVAIVVHELGARNPALSHNAAVPMNPASAMKLVTTLLVAILAGWMTTEIGRQPWIVQGLMRTSEGVSAHDASQVGFTLALFVVVYLVVFGAGTVYMLRLMGGGPRPGEGAEAMPGGPGTQRQQMRPMSAAAGAADAVPGE